MSLCSMQGDTVPVPLSQKNPHFLFYSAGNLLYTYFNDVRKGGRMIIVEGTVEEIIYANEVNGYTVCDVRCEDKVVTAVGYMPFLNVGEGVRLTGKWTTHPDYGEQLKVELYEKTLPDTAEAMEKYLASGVIKGVGPVTAAKIVERFGDETFAVIQSRPHMLAEVKGISFEKACSISRDFCEQHDLRQIVMFFQKYNIGPSFALKVLRVFGCGALEEIKKNPYRLAEEAIGLNFKTVDTIAMDMGMDPASGERVKSGIKYVLSRAAADGHTYLPVDKLTEYTAQLLDNPYSVIEDCITSLRIDRQIYVEDVAGEQAVYLPAFYRAELGVCRKIAQLSMAIPGGDVENIDEIIRKVEEEEGIKYEKYQSEAIRQALLNRVLVITGGPGTGKTTIIKGIIKIFEDNCIKYVLAAPTGRAAKRMSEATGREAKTIHRLLEVAYSIDDDMEQVFSRNEQNPLDAEAVIIDETSMVDVLLMDSLLKAIPPGARLILVGDIDQLPPVKAGNVLRDIIESGIVKTIRLTEIFRQARESMITVNAHLINSGEMPQVNVKDGDFFFIRRSGSDSILSTLVELCGKRLPDSYGYDFIKHVQVLSPVKKGDIGVRNLNVELQKIFNPPASDKREKVYGDFVFREGDKVMQVKNNYELKWGKPGFPIKDNSGVFNGDIGVITRVDEEEQSISVLFDNEREADYDFSILDELEPAYAITVHKSQGSEFPVIVMPVFMGPPLLMTRNLIYTAVTRAKELVVLVGSEAALAAMISNDKEMLRYSGLKDRLSKTVDSLQLIVDR